eukprot:8692726-Alexandrium_andersonii.AAC.1
MERIHVIGALPYEIIIPGKTLVEWYRAVAWSMEHMLRGVPHGGLMHTHTPFLNKLRSPSCCPQAPERICASAKPGFALWPDLAYVHPRLMTSRYGPPSITQASRSGCRTARFMRRTRGAHSPV